MAHAHRHDDIEVNVVAAGELVYLVGGRDLVVRAGESATFWATVPHQLVAAAAGTRSHWLTVPLSLLLTWPLPAAARDRLLSARPLVGAGGPAEEQLEGWSHDLGAGGEVAEIAVLEVQARLRRLVVGARDTQPGAGPVREVSGHDPRGAAMAAWIQAHCAEPIGPADVAATVHLHPHHAMGLFKASCGLTMTSFLAQCRVARAQQLLLATDLAVTEVGLRSGFGSSSRFHEVFSRAVGTSPGRYRRGVTR